MIGFVLAAALAAPKPDFLISDTTNNLSGERTVLATQYYRDAGQSSILQFYCDAGKPAVLLDVFDFDAPEWIVVVLGGGDGPDTPFIFERRADTSGELVLSGNPKVLISLLHDDEIREFVVQSSPDPRRMSFGMRGLRDAWKRVSSSCR